MTGNEIYLLTAFICSACDGSIAAEELELVNNLARQTNLFDGLDIEDKLNSYVAQINQNGRSFINDYISILSATDLSEEEQLNIIDVAIRIIESDAKIEYSEIMFFKKLRKALSISDDRILDKMPEIEDYLLPDIQTQEFIFEPSIKFKTIDLSLFSSTLLPRDAHEKEISQ